VCCHIRVCVLLAHFEQHRSPCPTCRCAWCFGVHPCTGHVRLFAVIRVPLLPCSTAACHPLYSAVVSSCVLSTSATRISLHDARVLRLLCNPQHVYPGSHRLMCFQQSGWAASRTQLAAQPRGGGAGEYRADVSSCAEFTMSCCVLIVLSNGSLPCGL
jgi:hypothetical protein